MTDVETLLAEQAELSTLIERGVHFSVPKRSLLKHFGKPERSFEIRQPFLGTLDALSNLYLKTGFSEEVLAENPVVESKQLIAKNARTSAKVVAIAILNDRWGIKLFTPFLATYLLWHVTPQKLFQLTMIINQLSNLGDFINSIRWMSGSRTTAPTRIEKPEPLA